MNIEFHKVLFSQINIISAIKNICPFNLIKGLINVLPKENPTNYLTNTDLFKIIQWNNINSIDSYLFNSCQLLTSKISQELNDTSGGGGSKYASLELHIKETDVSQFDEGVNYIFCHNLNVYY